MASSFLYEVLDASVQKHGAGTVFTVLEAMSKAHCVHLEMVGHGCFAKIMYPKKQTTSPRTTPRTCTPSSPSLSPCCLSRSALLSARARPPPGLHVPPPREPLRCVQLFDLTSADCPGDSADTDEETIIGQKHPPYLARIKNTFIDVVNADEDALSVGAASAPELRSHGMPSEGASKVASANQDRKNISPLILENALESLLSRLCAAHTEAKLEVTAQKLRADLGLDTDETSQDDQHLKT